MGFLDKMRSGQPPTSNATPGGLVTDPVCHMKVDPKSAAGHSEHGGVTYHFCSTGCKTRFDADPHRFLGAHSH